MRRLFALAQIVCALVLAVPAAPQTASDERERTIPAPDLEGMEPPVASQLRLARQRLVVSRESGLSPAQLGTAYGELGQLYHAYELTGPATACYRAAIELDPKDPRWPYLLALLGESSGDLEGAVALFERTLELEPAATPAKIRLGAALMRLGRLDEAAEAVETALSAGDPASLAVLGEIETARGNHARAVELLETALAMEPRASRLRYPLARSLRATGETERADEELSRAGRTGLAPIDPLERRLESLRVGETAHTLRGRRAFAAGQWEDARREFALAVDAAPASAGAHVNLATTLVALGDAEQAVRHLETALELDPDSQTAHSNLGRLLAFERSFETAREHLSRALELREGDAEARVALATVLLSTGEPDGALEQLAIVRRLAPGFEDGWLLAAQLLLDLGAPARAIELLEDGHAKLPGSSRIAAGLSRILSSGPSLELRNGAAALALAQEAFRANELPVHAEAVALALAELGRCGEAASWAGEAISRLASGDETTRRRLHSLRASFDSATGQGGCRP